MDALVCVRPPLEPVTVTVKSPGLADMHDRVSLPVVARGRGVMQLSPGGEEGDTVNVMVPEKPFCGFTVT